MRVADHERIRTGAILCRAVKELKTALRHATPDDIPAILALERATPGAGHWSERGYRDAFQPEGQDRMVLVIEEDGALLGFLAARFGNDECELENIVVATQSRRRGFASQLLQSLIAAARERHARRLLLEVRDANTSARTFYEKFGFGICGVRKSYYADPAEDAVLYTLTL